VTIERGQPWGDAVQSPTDLLVAPTDRAAREFVVRQRERGTTVRPVGLGGGDLARTMGGGHDRFPGIVTRASVDLLRVQAGDRVTWAIAHVVARRSWHRGEVVFAMNAQFFGAYDIAPRSHPNDGKVDILHVAAEMSWRARRAAARRARTGTHVPHPQLSTRQLSDYSAEFARPLVIWVDGQRWGKAPGVRITVEPDALTVYA
jgi:diacylglycerol kinase family enzyme